MATFTGYPASYNETYSQHGGDYSGYPSSNAVGKASSNGSYAQWYLNEGASAETYIYYDFDLSGIPQSATIDSVSCTAKAYVSQTNSSRVAVRQIQLRNGKNNPIGSASTISTSSSVLTLSCGIWTREMLNECGICIYVRRGSSSTTSNYYTRLYGATLTVEYTLGATAEIFTYTASASAGGTISPTSGKLEDGQSVTFEMTPDADYELKSVTSNGVSVPFQTTTVNGIENGMALLHCEDYTDSLGLATVTNYGASVSTSYRKFGSSSLYFNGSSSYLKIDMGSTQAYTLEFWFYTTSSNTSGWYPTLFSTKAYSVSGGTYAHVDDGSYSTYPVFRSNGASSTGNNGGYGSTVISRNTWHHFAYCRNGSSHMFFIDGVLQRTVSQSNPNSTNVFYLGCLYGSSSPQGGCYFQGYIDEILVSSNAKYTSGFTVPSTEFAAKEETYYTCEITVTEDIVVYATFGRAGFVPALSLKRNGSWITANRIYKKVGGVWTEISPEDIDTAINYVLT